MGVGTRRMGQSYGIDGTGYAHYPWPGAPSPATARLAGQVWVRDVHPLVSSGTLLFFCSRALVNCHLLFVLIQDLGIQAGVCNPILLL